MLDDLLDFASYALLALAVVMLARTVQAQQDELAKMNLKVHYLMDNAVTRLETAP